MDTLKEFFKGVLVLIIGYIVMFTILPTILDIFF